MVHFAGIPTTPHRIRGKSVMKRLALALLLFIFKELVVASVLTPEADHYDSYLLVGTQPAAAIAGTTYDLLFRPVFSQSVGQAVPYSSNHQR